MDSDIVRIINEGKRKLSEVDSAVRERLIARYDATWQSVENELRYVTQTLTLSDDMLTAGGYTRRGLLWRQQRLSGLLRLVEDEYTSLAIDAGQEIVEGQRRVITLGQLDGHAIVAANAPGITAGLGAALNVQAYERLIAATDPGSPLYKVLQQFGLDVGTVLERSLIEGAMRGHGVDKILASIRRNIERDAVPRWKLARITRTELMRSYRGSLFDSYERMGVQEWQWVAALSSRTCPACLAMHGRRFPMSEPMMKSHPNCRCVAIPVVEGIDTPTGDEWLRRQSARTQRRVFPTEGHYDAWKNGTTLADMTGMQHSRVWGDAVRVKALREIQP